MLGGKALATLDVPVDGSAQLVSVTKTIGADGRARWTVVYEEAPPVAPAPIPSPVVPASPSALAPSSSLPLPDASLAFAPAPPYMVPPKVHSAASAEQGLSMDRLFALKCQVKTYAWGKLGTDSLVGRLAEQGLEDIEIHSGTPYAELWMGTHPSGPSMVMLTSPWRTVTPLSEWIKLNPSLLGPRRNGSSPQVVRRRSMARMRAHSLPFLFKILSVRTALSIQAHPDKALAAELHFRQPDMYKDDNHKPEMAVAITPFEALCSFQPIYSVLSNCRATPELVALVGEPIVSALDDAGARCRGTRLNRGWNITYTL